MVRNYPKNGKKLPKRMIRNDTTKTWFIHEDIKVKY